MALSRNLSMNHNIKMETYSWQKLEKLCWGIFGTDVVTKCRSGSLSFEKHQTCSLVEEGGGKTSREKAVFDTGKQVGRDFFPALFGNLLIF